MILRVLFVESVNHVFHYCFLANIFQADSGEYFSVIAGGVDEGDLRISNKIEYQRHCSKVVRKNYRSSEAQHCQFKEKNSVFSNIVL